MDLSKDDCEKLTGLYKKVLILLKQDFMAKKSLNLRDAIGFISCFYAKILSHDNLHKRHPVIYNLPSDGILSL